MYIVLPGVVISHMLQVSDHHQKECFMLGADLMLPIAQTIYIAVENTLIVHEWNKSTHQVHVLKTHKYL